MKKPFTNIDLSERKCKKCGRYLKKNLIAKIPGAEYCWRCWREKGGSQQQ